MVTIQIDTHEAIGVLLGGISGFELGSTGYYHEDNLGPRFIDGREALRALLVRIPGVDHLHMNSMVTITMDPETVAELMHEIGTCSEDYDEYQAAAELTDKPLSILLLFKKECEIPCCLEDYIEQEPDTKKDIQLPN